MVGALVDTSVLVDAIRQRTNALNWLAAQVDLGITPVVRMELVAGAENRIDQRKALGLIAKLQMVLLTSDDQVWAMNQQMSYVLSHNIGMNDCLIASVAFRLQIPLYTINLKHFTPLLGALTQKPY